MTLSNIVRLSLCFAKSREYVAVVRTSGIVLITTVIVFIVLALSSASAILARQQHVEDARTAVEPAVIKAGNHMPATATYINDWDNQKVTRVVIAGARRSAQIHPPGISRGPLPAEVFVSPAFLAALPSQPLLRQAIDGRSIAGTIGRDGLVSSDELRIVQGIGWRDAHRSVLSTTESFGTNARLLVDLTGPLTFLLPLVLLVIFAPLLVALIIVSRLLAPETNQRFALLKALGVGRGKCRIIAALELLPAAFLGAFLGWLWFAAGWQKLSSVPGTEWSFWSEDTSIPMALHVVVPILCMLVTLLIAAAAIVPQDSPSTRPAHTSWKPRWWWLLPASGGAGLLVFSAFGMPDKDPSAKTVAICAAAVMLIGAPLTLHYLIDYVSTYMARRATTAGSLIGARWVGNRAGATFRLAMAVSVALLAYGVSAPFVASLRGDTSLGEVGLEAAKGYNLLVTNAVLTQRQLDDLPMTTGAYAYADARAGGHNSIVVLFASCPELQAIVQSSGCDGAPQWINIDRSPLAGYLRGYKAPIELPAGAKPLHQLPSSEVYAPLGETFRAAILVDSAQLDEKTQELDGYLVNLANGSTALDSFESSLAAVAPTAFYGNSYTDLVNQAYAWLGYLQFLQIGVGAGLLGMLVALIAAALRSVTERRRASATLGVLGASQGTRIQAHTISQAVPVLVSTTVAVLATLLFWTCLRNIDPGTDVGFKAYAVLLLLPFTLPAVVPALTLPAARADSSPTDARRHIGLWS